MNEPYQLPTGVSYEKNVLVEFFAKNGFKDPITSKEFHSEEQCAENRALRQCIKRELKANPAVFEGSERVEDLHEQTFYDTIHNL